MLIAAARPLMLIAAWRELPVKFSLTSNVTTSLPAPVSADVNVIQSAFTNTAQLQEPAALTVMLPCPPAVVKNCVIGETASGHVKVLGHNPASTVNPEALEAAVLACPSEPSRRCAQ